MKQIFYAKILTIFSMLMLNQAIAQPVLNELYTTPNGACNTTNRVEFFEIYNGSQGGGNAVANLGCYYLVTRWQNGGGGANNEGFFVVDFPSSAVTNSAGFFTAAPTLTAATQTQNTFPCEFTPTINWNSAGITTRYTWDGTTYVATAETNLFNLFDENAANMLVFLYNGSTLADGVCVGSGGNTAAVMSQINSWPSLTVSVNCTGSPLNQTINFAGVTQAMLEFVNPTAGTNNGFAREYDGNCGEWKKTSSPPYHTPNASNPGNVANSDTYWNVSYGAINYVSSTLITVDASLTSIQNAGLIHVAVYRDINNNGTYDIGIDPQYGASFSATAVGSTLSINGITLPPSSTCFVLLRADNNCFYTQNVFTTTSGPLPIKIMSFNAARSGNGVLLKWETELEENALEIVVERKSGSDYIQIASVPAQNNRTGSAYSHFDNITLRDIVYYRLKLVDKDGKFKYSEVRSVRAAGTKLAFTISPNPSFGRAVVSMSDIAGIDEVQVLDLSGRLLQKLPVTSNRLELNNLPRGTYLVRVSNNQTGETVVQKLSVL